MNWNQPPTNSFQQVRIPKGKHAAKPYWFSYGKRKQLSMQFLFTDYARYQLPGPDQMDWNKLCGISFCPLTNHRNSAMVSWRYNLEADLFELGFYHHVNGRRVIKRNASGEVWARCKVAGMLKIRFVIDHLLGQVLTTIETQESVVSDLTEISTKRRSRVINTWFGGNNPAPNDIHIFRKLI